MNVTSCATDVTSNVTDMT